MITLMQIILKGKIEKHDFNSLVDSNPLFVAKICEYYYMNFDDLKKYILSGDFDSDYLVNAMLNIIEGKKNYYPFCFIVAKNDFDKSAKKLLDKCNSILIK